MSHLQRRRSNRRNSDAKGEADARSCHNLLKMACEGLAILCSLLTGSIGADARNLDRLVPIWMANQNPHGKLIAVVTALDDHRFPNLFSAKSEDALPDPHGQAVRPGS